MVRGVTADFEASSLIRKRVLSVIIQTPDFIITHYVIRHNLLRISSQELIYLLIIYLEKKMMMVKCI